MEEKIKDELQEKYQVKFETNSDIKEEDLRDLVGLTIVDTMKTSLTRSIVKIVFPKEVWLVDTTIILYQSFILSEKLYMGILTNDMKDAIKEIHSVVSNEELMELISKDYTIKYDGSGLWSPANSNSGFNSSSAVTTGDWVVNNSPFLYSCNKEDYESLSKYKCKKRC